ncbi:MAG: hypothetical protein A2474_00225 [Elusimicrobia bacterium RIFOXYC2_FULL_34_12]|nr:MAG: hypothetical protein A2474_00225 [Elusimicrobia bacterium RIFOXYC2_FULL_34_12]OGS38638.1 MAG: hypothetical protein A2551_06430 [Elusimicrobia bacterium RIFOXYD2_FULL_34_30]HAM39471.1 phosphatidylglycerophosphatase A [Elusimicrobiota bacterium]
MFFSNKIKFFVKLFASGFTIGYIPIAPGTFATLLAVAFWWYLPRSYFYILTILLFLISIYVCGKAEKIYGNKDDKRIVIDEIIGYFTAIIFLPKSFLVLILSFVLFRYFDIKKPLFIKSVQNYNGSLGILSDDLISGILTNIIIRIILLCK